MILQESLHLSKLYELLCPERYALLRPAYLKAQDIVHRLNKEHVLLVRPENVLKSIIYVIRHLEIPEKRPDLKMDIFKFALKRLEEMRAKPHAYELSSSDMGVIDSLILEVNTLLVLLTENSKSK